MRSAADNGVQKVKILTAAIDGLSLTSSTTNNSNSNQSPDDVTSSQTNSNGKSSKPRRNRKKNKQNNTNNNNNFNSNESQGGGSDYGGGGGDTDMPIPVITSVTSLAGAPPSNGSVYSGSNIVLVSNDNYEGPHVMPPSCIDNVGVRGGLRFTDEEEPEEILGLDIRGGGDSSSGVLEEILGLDLESEYDEDDSTLRAASWCLANANHHQTFSDPSQSTNARYSYQAASGFQIGPIDTSSSSYNRSDNHKMIKTATEIAKSPDSEEEEEEEESSTSCGSYVPAFAYCAAFLGDFSKCQAQNCSSLANIKCAQCLNAYYCTEDHQKMSWPLHKEFCTPYRIEELGPGAADGLPMLAAVACRNIPEGQVIFEEKAMLVFPLAESVSDSQFDHVLDQKCVIAKLQKNPDVICKASKPACLGCMRVVEFIGAPRYQCSKCGLPLCSYNCQFLVAHQAGECDPVHSQKPLEDELLNHCPHTLYMDVEILRALQMEVYDRGMWDRFLEMKDNVRVEAYKTTERFNTFAQNIESLVPFSAKFSGYNLDLIKDVHAIISSLSFRPSLTSSFKLLFNVQPLFAHDCVPNTLHYIKDEHTGDQNRMRLVTKAASAIIEGEMITLDFTPSPYLPYPRRKKILNDHLNISNCLCSRCQNPRKLGDFTAEVKCPMCRVGTVYPEVPSLWEESVWSCSQCQEEVSYHKVEDIEQECQKEIQCILSKSEKVVTVSNLMSFINRRGKLDLNPDHHLILMSWCFVETYLRKRLKAIRRPDPTYVYSQDALNEFRILGEYVEVMEKHMDSIRPGIWIDRGINLFYKFYSSFVQLSRELQDRKINRADFTQRMPKCMKSLMMSLKTLSVYEGYNSPLVSQLTQEVTSAFADIKKYYEHLISNKSNENLPLPSFRQIGIFD